MLDVDHVIADLQVAEVGKKCRNLGLLALRTRNHRLRLVEQIARAENRQVSVGQNDAVRHIGFDQRAGEDLAGEIGGLVGVAFSAASAAAQAKGNGVFAEDIGQALDFADIRHGDQHAILFGDLLLDVFQHRRNRAMKTLRRLRMEVTASASSGTRDFEMLDRGSGKAGQLLPPVVGRKIQIRRPHQIADSRCVREPLRFATRCDQTLSSELSGSSTRTTACGSRSNMLRSAPATGA